VKFSRHSAENQREMAYIQVMLSTEGIARTIAVLATLFRFGAARIAAAAETPYNEVGVLKGQVVISNHPQLGRTPGTGVYFPSGILPTCEENSKTYKPKPPPEPSLSRRRLASRGENRTGRSRLNSNH
jgi:hypothetical protein